MNPANAIDWHSQIASDFDEKYKGKNQFSERYELWTTIINKYSKEDYHSLDIGCGSGIFSFYLATKNKSVIGIDGSMEMLKLCENKKTQLDIGNLTFLQADISKLNTLQFEKADLIITSSVLEYLNDIDTAFIQLKSLLKPNGTLIFSLPNKSSLYRIFESISFRLIKWPKYFRYVRHVSSLNEMKLKLKDLDMEIVEFAYYAKTPLFSKLFRPLQLSKYSENLFLIVAKNSLT